MITKFKKYNDGIITIKLFEDFENYIYNSDMFMIYDVMNYLGVNTPGRFIMMDEESELKSIYNVDVIDFFKEIIMNKTILFQDINRFDKNRTIKGEVNDVAMFSYKDDSYIKVEILSPKVKNIGDIAFKDITYEKTIDNWFLIKNNNMISIYDYDADNKPLHQKVKLEKEGEKYNL